MKRALLLAASLVLGCSDAPTFVSNCTTAPPGPDALTPPGRPSANVAILPGGRQLTPAGQLLDVGGYPIALRVLPGDRYAVVTDDAEDDQALRVVDLMAADPLHAVVSQVSYPIAVAGGTRHTPGLLYGLALTSDGKRIYVSNGGYDPIPDTQPITQHYNTVQVFDIAGTPPVLTANDPLTLQLVFSSDGQRVPSGVALSSDDKLLYVANQQDNTLAILDLTAGATYGVEIGRAALPGIGAYDVAVDEASHTAFVSMWGGATSQGNSVDGVVAVDVTNPQMPMAAVDVIATGKAAEAELLIAGKLYVANADADTLSIVDAASRTVKTLPTTNSMILGATPNNLAIELPSAGSAGRVYLANAGENSVVALDLDTMAILGRVPTAWYPTAVAVLADGTLVVASARGLGRGPNDGTPEPSYADGTLQIVPRPSDDQLKQGDMQVAMNLDRPHSLETTPSCPAGKPAMFPLPLTAGGPTPIKHVFFVVRENKTYDDLFGDLPGGNGKPELVSWGETNTPNAHAIARSFVLLDNFYSHAELSVQGHEWTTSCIANDYTEKSWSHSDDYGRGYLLAVAWGPPNTLSRLATPGTGSIWAHLDQAGVPYHNYGEVVNNADAKRPPDPEFPGVYFNTKISDVDKVNYVLSNINDPNFTVEPFSYLLIPNDHTNGTSHGSQTPQSLIADNDEATGRFLDGLSHSKIWDSSIVFVVEDDPAGNADHVEEHRSICLVASPWIKRGYHSTSNFDLGSVYHTMELLIGVGPMNLNDGHAGAMYELFSDKPDSTPYTFLPRQIPMALNPDDAPLSAESDRIDFSRPDRGDLRRILWKATHGKDAEPPGGLRKRARADVDDDD